MEKDLKDKLEREGYKELKEVNGRGICGIMSFMFTVGLCYGLTEHSYEGRYCYPLDKAEDALLALKVWSGIGDPPGRWIKHKGNLGEWSKG